jgi:hypothetical protein
MALKSPGRRASAITICRQFWIDPDGKNAVGIFQDFWESPRPSPIYDGRKKILAGFFESF